MNNKFLLGKCIKCKNQIFQEDLNSDELQTFQSNGLCKNCQHSKRYNTKHFIIKFLDIPENKWATSKYEDDDKLCALGHCGEITSEKPTKESLALEALFEKHGLRVSLVNDGECSLYKQKTPKKRILAALTNMDDE